MDKTLSVDLAIIGAGTAGISAFQEASKVTNKIVIIDHGPLGTTCARVGCMPSKALIQVSDSFHQRMDFSEMGIKGGDKLQINIPEVMQHVRKLRDYFTSGTLKWVESLGDRFIKGNAEFCESNVLKVNGQRIVAKNIIIATGTSSIVPKEWRLFNNMILISETIFEQENFGKKIAVIGGGTIGIELGQALSRLGIAIELFHSHGELAGLTDPMVNAYAIDCFKTEFPMHLNAVATVEKNNKSLVVGSGNYTTSADQIIAALGRKPNLSLLNLEKIGVKLDAEGVPLYDRQTMKVQGFPIYIAGDAADFRPLLHEAADEGRITGYNAVREKPHRFIRRTPLAIVFSQPNIAIVGKSFKKLADSDFVIGEVKFDDQGRARIMGQNKGMLRIYANHDDGKLLGAEMIAPAGEHLAHMLSHAIQQNMTVFDVLKMPFYHPVVEEGMRTALRNIVKQVKTKGGENFDLAMCDSEGISTLS